MAPFSLGFFSLFDIDKPKVLFIGRREHPFKFNQMEQVNE